LSVVRSAAPALRASGRSHYVNVGSVFDHARNTLPQIHENVAHPAGKLTNKSYTNYWCTVKDWQFRNTLSHSLCPKPKCDSGA